jgi:hypothetical protein
MFMCVVHQLVINLDFLHLFYFETLDSFHILTFCISFHQYKILLGTPLVLLQKFVVNFPPNVLGNLPKSVNT